MALARRSSATLAVATTDIMYDGHRFCCHLRMVRGKALCQRVADGLLCFLAS